jgi:hypothetical protein
MAKKGFAYLRQHHIGLLALFIALSGTAYAATLPRNSVGTAQLKKNAVTSVKVKDHSLLRKDFKTSELLRGPAGPRGLTGATGPQGPQGVAGRNGATNVTARDSDGVAIAAGDTATAVVSCDAGERAVGGGGITVDGNATLTDSFAVDQPPTTWRVDYRNATASPDTIFASVICASP